MTEAPPPAEETQKDEPASDKIDGLYKQIPNARRSSQLRSCEKFTLQWPFLFSKVCVRVW